MSHPRRQHHAEADLQSLAALPGMLPLSPLHSSPSTCSLPPPDSPSSATRVDDAARPPSPPHNPAIVRPGSGGTAPPTPKHSRTRAHPQAPAASDDPTRAPSSSTLRSRPSDRSQLPPRHPARLSLPLSPARLIAHSEFPSPPTGVAESTSSLFSVSSDPTATGRLLGGTPLQSTLTSTSVSTTTATATAARRVSLLQKSGHARAPGATSIHVSAMAESTGQRMMPRTSSIDSAISSLSSASHSHKSSMDSNNVTPADIANLISTAGSPEAVIIHLLKEKQHAATQNAQLWKLVDKQRTMLLALNKDLERSIRDKEKYRKRLKEAQNNPLPISVNAKKETYTANNDTTQGRVIHSRETNRPEDSQNTGDPINPSPISQETDIDHQTPTDSNPDSASHGTDSPETQLPFEVKANTNSDGTGQQGTLSQHATQVDQDAFRTNHYDAYKSSVDAPAKIPHPVRKPPPAPLKLDEARKVRPHILLDDRKASSDSEYDEIMEDSEIPKMERGRRKTREEDDRLREAVMLKEQEIRSRSSKKKLKQLESLESNQKDQVQTFLNVGLPASPRSAMSGSPFRNPAAVHSPPDSISNVLQSGARDFSLSDKSRMTSPLSPGLPQSPRPADRPLGSPMPRFPKDLGSLVSPPASPRILTEGQYQNMLVPTSSSQTVPVDTPQDNTQEKGDPAESKPEKVDDSVPTYKLTVEKGSPVSASETSHTIYHGLVSAEYPDLLLPPSALPSIDVKVSSSRLRPSRSSYLALRPIEEEPVFTLSVRSRGSQTELWRVEKAIIALPQLDQQIKQICNFSTKLPERSIFSGHSPAKVDARRVALNAYFESLLTYPMDEATSLVVCQFLTADAIEPRDDESNLLHGPGNGKPPISFGPDGKPRMEGYLTKRGKNFGGWKSRYFVLNGPELRYYESPGGPHLGTIKIQHAQIGKQSPSGKSQSPSRTDDDSENQYRHAFLVLEPKKRDTSALVRHVLCAESDKERDIWVETLLCYVEPREMDDESHSHHPQVSKQGPPRARLQPAHPRKMTWENSQPGPTETLQALSYDDVIAAEAPVLGPGGGKISSNGFHAEQVDRPSGHDNSPTHKSISGPTNAMRIQDAGAWGNKTVTSTKEKKRSIWGFRAAAGVDFAGQGIRQDSVGSLYDDFLDRKGPVRPVFGLPLADAVVFCGPSGLDCGLPAVVYRCLQYLRAQNAELEEGIFRLSGSNVVIRALKERFNTEGDLNFLEGDSYYDVHAVASLFKQYLRELPTTVLTKELHLEFIRVLDLDERQQKIMAFHTLVRRLPRPNLDLLKALAQFLIVIINNADINKMTVRNVGIVFAPTLNIPAPVFSLFLTEFDAIFGDNSNVTSNTRQTELTVDSQHLNSEDIRSPRHQMFSDLPTPAYGQHSFGPHRMGARGDSKHLDALENHITGFIPMHPTYDPPPIPHSQSEQSSHPHLRAIGNFLTPENQTTKNKRRESSILFM